MQCGTCAAIKLSTQFLQEPISDTCKELHYHNICLKCLVAHFENTPQCPVADCNAPVSPERIEVLKKKCERADPCLPEVIQQVAFHHAQGSGTSSSPAQGAATTINVSLLNGTTIPTPYSPTLTVDELKRNLQRVTGVEIAKQKLVFNHNIIRGQSTMKSLGIAPPASILLVIQMIAILPDMKKITFDLGWEYDSTKPQFLDGSCFAFKKTDEAEICDCLTYDKRTSAKLGPGIEHSGDSMEFSRRKGHHYIKIDLGTIDPAVTKMYFCLSTYKEESLSFFTRTSVSVYEDSHPNEILSEFNIAAATTESVVMCCLSRYDNEWQVEQIGVGCKGKVANSKEMFDAIKLLSV
jgi:stress response protein SCP2